MTNFHLPNKTEDEVRRDQLRIESSANALLKTLQNAISQNLDLLVDINNKKAKKNGKCKSPVKL